MDGLMTLLVISLDLCLFPRVRKYCVKTNVLEINLSGNQGNNDLLDNNDFKNLHILTELKVNFIKLDQTRKLISRIYF